MIVRTSPSVTYSMWLKRILDTHTSQSWDAEPTDIREREDEELNDLWTEIGGCYKQRLWGLSSDLNTLRDCETWFETDWPPMTKDELGRAQSEAFQRKDWDKFLEYLRRPPRFLPQNMVDYLRGRAWMEMGHPEVALLFFDNAARLEAGNSTYGVLALECLKTMQDWPEVLKRSQAYLQDSATPARLLFRAADAFHVYANHTGEQQYYHEALRAVEEGFGRLDQAGQQEQLSSILAEPTLNCRPPHRLISNVRTAPALAASVSRWRTLRRNGRHNPPVADGNKARSRVSRGSSPTQ